MSASSTAKRAARLTAAVLLAGASLGLASAAAQDGGVGEPLDLAPAESGGDDRAAPTGTGEADAGPGGDGAPAGEETPAADTGGDGAPSGIQVDTLGALDAAALGVLDPGGAGLGPALWDGTPRGLAAGLISALPARIESPTVHGLVRRLLLSSAAAPPSGEDGDILTARLRALLRMGALDGVRRLLDVMPRGARTPVTKRLRAKAMLLQHDTKAACARVREGVAESDHVFWQQALAVCQHAQGKPRQAGLTVDLLRERETVDAGAFIRAHDALQGDGAPDAETVRKAPTAVTLALLGATRTPVPESLLDDAAPTALAAIARAPGTPVERRIRAGERAVAVGALDADALTVVYGLAEFDDATLTRAADASTTKEMAPPRRRALWARALARETQDAVRAEVARKLLATDRPALRAALVRVVAPTVAEIAPARELAWFAGDAVRALAVTGRTGAAGAWLDLLRGAGELDGETRAAARSLIPHARVLGAGPPAAGGLDAWRETAGGEGRREALVLAAGDALGWDTDARWQRLAARAGESGRDAPAAATLYGLRAAGRAGRVGETVLLTGAALGGRGLDDVHPLTLGTAVAALDRAGLTSAARRVALAGFAANGP